MLMVGFEVTQPSPGLAQLMRIMVGVGAVARACAAADAHDAHGRFRGHLAIARTSSVDAHYARLGHTGKNLGSSGCS